MLARALLIAGTLLSITCFGEEKDISLRSPNGHIHFAIHLTESAPIYSVWYDNTPLIVASPLSLVFRGSGNDTASSVFGPHLHMLDAAHREGGDAYTLPIGKNGNINDHYNEYTIGLEESNHRQINLVVRLYNDGLAFRWVFPRQAHWENYDLLAEHTGFRLSGDPILQASFLPNYTSSHEGRYTRLPFSAVKSDTLMDTPVFLEFSEKNASGKTGSAQLLYMAITEAQLTDYAGMYLVKHDGLLKSELSPLPGGHGSRVKAVLPHRTPWRVMFIGPRPGAFLESNLLTDLNDPCAIKDLGWLHPGKTDFHWWNGDVIPDTTYQPGINFESEQYYIDFCARNNIQYHTVIGYGGIAWYTNDGISYDAGPHSDPTQPLPGLDMQRICDYAAAKSVGIRVWVQWKALCHPEEPANVDRRIETVFTQFEKWGIKGMMVDFLDRDDQQMVNLQLTILRKAAAHHLHIQFHGAYKPTGMIRTYPNELTREGTLNYENDKWGNPITPDDDLNVVFTRLLAGPTDYHLGGFRAATERTYKPHFVHPFVLGTRCHMLAMYVILESYLPMVCDDPMAYDNQPGFDFIKNIPATWDETRVPVAIPGQWAAIIRRKDDTWYLGAINNHTARDTSIPLSFLPPGQYKATIYSDAPDVTQDPNHLVTQIRQVQPTDSLAISLAAGGGLAVTFQRQETP